MENEKKHRVGVYICHCGGNISDYVDVARIRELVGQDDDVVIARDVMFACADSNQKDMVDDIRDQNLDAIVVASCSPKLHLHTFRNVAARAGLNPYRYVQVNVREQCSWPHSDCTAEATAKAAGLVEAGIRRVLHSESLEPIRVEAARAVAVTGGGISGLRAALAIAAAGNHVYVIEKSGAVGGKISGRKSLFPDGSDGGAVVSRIMDRVKSDQRITLFLNARVKSCNGSVGQFTVTVGVGRDPEETMELKVGAVLVATGFDDYRPSEGEFGFGLPGVVTLNEFNALIESGSESMFHEGRPVRRVGFIYCVGMRQTKGKNRYCSRTCCASAVGASLELHRRYPGVSAYHFYRDIRTYGKLETMYAESSRAGDVYFMFTEKEPPAVTPEHGRLNIRVRDLLTKKEEIDVPLDLVVLVTGMVPHHDAAEVAGLFKIPVGSDGFFNEIHPKLRPVETVINGVFLGGCCQGPRNVTESVQSALAAAAKISSVIGSGTIELDPVVARVREMDCTWCGKCAEVCEYGAIFQVESDGRAVAAVNEPSCVGCGVCGPVCPTNAIDLACFTDGEIESMIDGFSLDLNIAPSEAPSSELSEVPSIGMREYPATWQAILSAVAGGPLAIPAISEATGLDSAMVTRHVMTMIRYRVMEPAGIDDSDEYHLYRKAGH